MRYLAFIISFGFNVPHEKLFTSKMYVESVKALKAHFMQESDIQPPLDPHLTLNPIAHFAPDYFHSLVRDKGDSKKGSEPIKNSLMRANDGKQHNNNASKPSPRCLLHTYQHHSHFCSIPIGSNPDGSTTVVGFGSQRHRNATGNPRMSNLCANATAHGPTSLPSTIDHPAYMQEGRAPSDEYEKEQDGEFPRAYE